VLASASYVVTNLARQIAPGDVVFTGVNSTAATAACLLAKRCYAFSFTHLNVAGGIDARPATVPRSSGDPSLLTGTAAIFNNEDFYDLCLRGGVDIAFLGAAQVDASGHANVSVIGDWHAPKVRLPGGGGAAVMMPTAKRVATWRTEHSPRALVDKLDFVTAAGNMATLVTPLAVFQRELTPGGRFRLESWNPASSVDEIKSHTGFAFDVSGAHPTEPITSRESEALASLDPQGRFAAEVRA
jgi:glutaconate CoA-transferase subunit B